MALTIAHVLVTIAGVWIAIGIAFALAFATIGVGRIDHDARTGSAGFRILILPATVALWPVLALRRARGVGEPAAERNAHRDAAHESRP